MRRTIVLIVFLTVVSGLLRADAPLPASRTLTVAGLSQPVEVMRDRWGVNHIYANSEHDLFFTQGYAAARGVSGAWHHTCRLDAGRGHLATQRAPGQHRPGSEPRTGRARARRGEGEGPSALPGRRSEHHAGSGHRSHADQRIDSGDLQR